MRLLNWFLEGCLILLAASLLYAAVTKPPSETFFDHWVKSTTGLVQHAQERVQADQDQQKVDQMLDTFSKTLEDAQKADQAKGK